MGPQKGCAFRRNTMKNCLQFGSDRKVTVTNWKNKEPSKALLQSEEV